MFNHSVLGHSCAMMSRGLTEEDQVSREGPLSLLYMRGLPSWLDSVAHLIGSE